MEQRFWCIVIGYLFGCILTAEIVTHVAGGKSTSEIGSGNPGMANVMASLGFRWGALVLLGDLLKTLTACLICYFLFPDLSRNNLTFLYTGIGVCLGHNFPFWRKFKGGKGVAVTCFFIFLYMPLWGLLADICGMLVVFATGYLPLGAVVITAVFIIPAFLFGSAEAGILAVITFLIMLSRHIHGLIRIKRGTEKRNLQIFKR